MISAGFPKESEPPYGRVAQAVRGVGRALRAHHNHAKTPKRRKDWQPLAARSGVRALPFTSRTSWATRPDVGGYTMSETRSLANPARTAACGIFVHLCSSVVFPCVF